MVKYEGACYTDGPFNQMVRIKSGQADKEKPSDEGDGNQNKQDLVP